MMEFGRNFLMIHLTWALINLAGISSASSTPGQPANLTVSSVHDLTITLRWTRPKTTAGLTDNSTLSYTVSYKAIGDISSKRLIVPTESAQLDLVFKKWYNIFVQAMHRQDHQIKGAWSRKLVVNTNNLVPAKPTNFKIASIREKGSKFQATLTWDKPTTTTSGITDSSTIKYYISYKVLKSGPNRQTQSPTERYSLGSLAAASTYQIKVRAFKTFKPEMVGDWSDPKILQTNESRPSQPPGNVQAVSNTPSSLTVSWSPIPKSGRNGVILGFVVFYCEQTACESKSWYEKDAKLAYSHELQGLVSGKQYSVRVAGYTKIGRGMRSPTIKRVVTGGLLLTTTRETTSQKSTTIAPETTQSTPIKSTKTVTVQVETVTNVSTESLTTIVVFPTEPKKTEPTLSRTVATVQSTLSSEKAATSHPSEPFTPVVAKLDQARKTSKDNMLNKILIIGAPVGGAILLVIIFVIVFSLARKRSRKRRQLLQNGAKPRRSRDMVTRGAYSVRYESPSAASTLGGDSMTEGLLSTSDEPDQPEILVEQPNGTVPSTDTENVPLVASGYSEKCDPLRVDLNSEQSKLDDGASAGLYDSIGSLTKIGCAPNGKSDDEDRYVTQDQINAARQATCERSQAQASLDEGHYKTPKEVAMEDFYKRPKDVLNGSNTYVNMNGPQTENLYETVGPKRPEEPVYENTPGGAEEHADTEGGIRPDLL